MDDKFVLMVLNDGDTYSTIDGCHILIVDLKNMKKIWDGERIKNVEFVAKVNLSNIVLPGVVTHDQVAPPEDPRLADPLGDWRDEDEYV